MKKVNTKKVNVSRILEKHSILLILLVMIVISSFLNQNFFTYGNIFNIMRQLAVPTILAYGASMLIISGMIDLSQGSVLALSGTMAVMVFHETDSLILSVLVALVIGVICNLLNALMVTYFNTPAFIATLAMQMVARGVALSLTGGQNLLQLGRFTVFGQGNVGPVPISLFIMLGITVIVWYILHHTRFGRSLYAMGGNQEAAIASGIQVSKNKYIVYAINGLLVGLAGVLFMSRVNSGLPNGAVGFEMEGLTAAIIGGTSFSGGVGTAIGTLAGAFIIGILNNIMNLIGVGSFTQQIVRGVIVALAVIWDIRSKNKKTKKIILAEDSVES